MQQVGAEAALGHQPRQILVGGRDHPHVDPDQLAPADPEELAFGQHPQQPGLQRQRHVSDLVQEQGAAVGLLEAADVALAGPGKGAGFVPEQLAFQQLGRHRGGVHGHERPACARRFTVQRARHQLLAGTGFAGNEHVERRLRQPADGAEQLAHGRGLSHQGAGVRLGRGRLGRIVHGGACQRARRQRHRVVQVERLGQEVVRAAAEGTRGAGNVGMRRHHHHRQRRQPRPELFQQRQAVFAGHAHVGEQKLRRRPVRQRIDHRLRRLEPGHLVSGITQRRGQHEAHAAVVIDNPDPSAHGCPPSSGNNRTNTVCPGRER